MNSPSSTLLRNVRVIDPSENIDRTADVLIGNGIIRSIEPSISPEDTCNLIDASGYIFAPGLVDLYSRSDEPGYEERETLESLIAAATAGGFTRVAILPNTTPPIDNPAILSTLQAKSQYLSDNKTARLQFWGTLTLGREGKQMAELTDMLGLACGFTDTAEIADLGLVRRVLEYLHPFKPLIALNPVNRQLRGNGVLREGENSLNFGLPGDSFLSETVALASILEIVGMTGTPVHIARVSTGRGVGLIREAKGRGLPVTASVTWIHLLLNTSAVGDYDSNLRLEPPLGEEADRRALIAGIKDGTIDVIAVDHRPYTYEEKTVPFAEAPAGTIGLELALPLLWDKLVKTGELTALELWRALSLNPCRCLQQKPPLIKEGEKAEAILFDPDYSRCVTGDSLKSLSRNTFWLNSTITGKVIELWNI